MSPRLVTLAPQFLVDDLEKSMAWYRKLGFAQTLMLAGYYEQREAALRMMCLLRAPDEQAPPDDWLLKLRRQ